MSERGATSASRTPEERELEKKRSELAILEEELAQRELELTTLQSELRAFEARYLRIVGIHYAELDELEAQIAETQARLSPKDDELQEQASQARTQAQESARTVGDRPIYKNGKVARRPSKAMELLPSLSVPSAK